MQKALFQLEMLTCPSCINQIEMPLQKTAGVLSTRVLFHLGKVRIEFDEMQVSIDQLRKIINRSGYSIVSTKSV